MLGASSPRSGILLGRSRRCDAGRVLSVRTISRVHLLLIELGGIVYVVDTASYNGLWDGERLRARVSMGGAIFARDDDAETLMKRADESLYAAKKQGRGKLVWNDTS